ncbi:unnamed protein product [Rotaria sp. Silwood2]|nr:unnamed protein product [Rotaria sp. Silwood2]CAF4223325.1 unnamed protein product [Rotaria sp. Silwood2]
MAKSTSAIQNCDSIAARQNDIIDPIIIDLTNSPSHKSCIPVIDLTVSDHSPCRELYDATDTLVIDSMSAHPLSSISSSSSLKSLSSLLPNISPSSSPTHDSPPVIVSVEMNHANIIPEQIYLSPPPLQLSPLFNKIEDNQYLKSMLNGIKSFKDPFFDDLWVMQKQLEEYANTAGGKTTCFRNFAHK